MFRHGLLRFLLALLVIGVLIAGGTALYRTGMAQGYQLGALAANSANKGAAPQLPYNGYMPFYPGYPGFGFPFFHPFGIFLGIGFFLLILFLIGGAFRMAMWRRWGGPQAFGQGRCGYPAEPPWHRAWHEQRSEQPSEAPSGQPEKDSAPGETPARA